MCFQKKEGTNLSVGVRTKRNKLKELRVGKMLSQVGLSVASGVWQSKISNLERYNLKPSSRESVSLAAALEVSVSDIWPDN